jgi:integrase
VRRRVGACAEEPRRGCAQAKRKHQRGVFPPSLAVVERMRALLLAERRLRNATLLAVLAYAGLRPQEALCLAVAERPRQNAPDRPRTERRGPEGHEHRTHALRTAARASRADLAAWRLASDRAGADELVFPTSGGGLWRDHDWRNWRRRVFDPLAASVGTPRMRPYDLRHAFRSLLIAEDASVVEVAAKRAARRR